MRKPCGNRREGFSESDLLRFFNSLCETEAALREAVHPRYVLEMGLMKLVEMRKLASLENILKRIENLTSGSGTASPASAAAATTEKKTLISDNPPVRVEKIPVAPAPPPPPREAFTAKPPPAMPEFTGGPAFDDDRDEEAEDFGESPFSSEELFDAPTAIPEPVAPMPRSFVPAVIRLLPLSAEELEHADDTKLDDAYEEKLTFAGDNLKPLAMRAR